MARKKATDAKAQFTIDIKLGDTTLKGRGETALAALMSIPKPEKIMSKAIVTISDGTKKKEMLFMPIRLKRLFYSPTFQAIQVKSLVIGMK